MLRHDAHAWPAWLALVLLMVMLVIGSALAGFSVLLTEFLPVAYLFIALIGGSIRLRHLAFQKSADALAVIGLFYMISCVGALTASVMAASAMPYVDASLSAADHAIGFDWIKTYNWLQVRPLLWHFLANAYDALMWAPQLLILLLAILRPRVDLFKFLSAWVIALVLTVALFRFSRHLPRIASTTSR